MNTPAIQIINAHSEAHWQAVRELLAEYALTLSALDGFEGFESEMRTLPGDYAPPRGAFLLAFADGHPAGCCAIRPLDSCDYANASEMKRLFVRRAFRGFGLGRTLAETALLEAQQAGYSCTLLDTLDDMEAARALYEDLGFEPIPPYYHNMLAGAHCLKVVL